MVKVAKIKGTRSELLAKLYEMLAKESGTSACRMFFIRQEREEKNTTCKDEKVIVGVFKKVS